MSIVRCWYAIGTWHGNWMVRSVERKKRPPWGGQMRLNYAWVMILIYLKMSGCQLHHIMIEGDLLNVQNAPFQWFYKRSLVSCSQFDWTSLAVMMTHSLSGDEFSTGRMLWDIGDDSVGFCRYWHWRKKIWNGCFWGCVAYCCQWMDSCIEWCCRCNARCRVCKRRARKPAESCNLRLVMSVPVDIDDDYVGR